MRCRRRRPTCSTPELLARNVVNSLGPGDLASVVYTLDKRDGQAFTRDRSRLLAAVDRFNAASDDGVALGRRSTPFRAGPSSTPSTVTSERSTCRSSDTLRGVVDSLAALPGRRKAVVLVSVGIPVDAGVRDSLYRRRPTVEVCVELNRLLSRGAARQRQRLPARPRRPPRAVQHGGDERRPREPRVTQPRVPQDGGRKHRGLRRHGHQRRHARHSAGAA